MDFEDREITCGDCGQPFLFSASEQTFFAEKGFADPKRCRNCRRARRSNRDGARANGGSANRNRPMYDAVCSECGEATQVPFEPQPDRPVYCRDCFQARRSSRHEPTPEAEERRYEEPEKPEAAEF